MIGINVFANRPGGFDHMRPSLVGKVVIKGLTIAHAQRPPSMARRVAFVAFSNKQTQRFFVKFSILDPVLVLVFSSSINCLSASRPNNILFSFCLSRKKLEKIDPNI